MTDALHQAHRAPVILLKPAVLADGVESAHTPNVCSLPEKAGPSNTKTLTDLVLPVGLTDRIDILQDTRCAGQSVIALLRFL